MQTIEHDEVHLHAIRVPAGGFAELLLRVAGDLSEAEIEAAHRFVFDRDRMLYAVSHVFLRRTLAQYLGGTPRSIPIVRQGNERPELAGRQLRFNLTHTAGLAVVAIAATADVGVDAERIDNRRETNVLAPVVFTAEEQGEWDGVAEGFFEHWTLKEAYIKARGLGLALDLQQFGVSAVPSPHLVCAPEFDDPAQWHFHSFTPTPEHRAAAAVRMPADAEVKWTVNMVEAAF